MGDKYLDWLEGAQIKKPDLKEQLIELGNLYQKRLWHQLTLALQQHITSPAFQKDGNFLPQLYTYFIAGFAYRLNPLKLAMIAEVVAKQYREAADAGKTLSRALLIAPGFLSCCLALRFLFSMLGHPWSIMASKNCSGFVGCVI